MAVVVCLYQAAPFCAGSYPGNRVVMTAAAGYAGYMRVIAFALAPVRACPPIMR